MVIHSADFVISQTDYKKCPEPTIPEYAFIGRSNVGKSSLINMLTSRNKLAKISSTPGKTQTINHFIINEDWYLVDLPGYGYAKVSKSSRNKFSNMTYEYIKNRPNLEAVFVLVDSRIEPQKLDLEFMGWLGKNQIPMAMVFTKTDKLGSSELNKKLVKYKKRMLQDWDGLPETFITSAETGLGRDEILGMIDNINLAIKDRQGA